MNPDQLGSPSTTVLRTIRRPVWYLACPYAHANPAVRKARFKAICHDSAHYIDLGVTVFSPIAHTHPIEVEGYIAAGLPAPSADVWRDFDLPFMEMCIGCITVTLPGWEKSTGVEGERDWFRDHELPDLLDHGWREYLPTELIQSLAV